MGDKPQRLPGLDGLRAFSIALVVVCHLAEGNQASWSVFLQHLGPVGVNVFFVISGFLITSLLAVEQRRTGSISLRNFYWRRAFRILPAAFAFLICISILTALGLSNTSWMDILASAAFFRNVYSRTWAETAHFWSLSVEEQYYLIWPALFLLLPRRVLNCLILGCILLVPVWRQLNHHAIGGGDFNPHRLDLLADTILSGCVLALARESGRFKSLLSSRLLRSQYFAIVLSALPMLVVLPGAAMFHGIRFVFIPLSNLCVALLINFAIENRPSAMTRLLNYGPIVWIGWLSYSLYLWQQLFCFDQSRLRIGLPWNLLASVSAATASYYLIEQPMLRLRRRIQEPVAPDPTLALAQ